MLIRLGKTVLRSSIRRYHGESHDPEPSWCTHPAGEPVRSEWSDLARLERATEIAAAGPPAPRPAIDTSPFRAPELPDMRRDIFMDPVRLRRPPPAVPRATRLGRPATPTGPDSRRVLRRRPRALVPAVLPHRAPRLRESRLATLDELHDRLLSVSGYCLTLLRGIAVADAIERLGGNDTGEIRDLARRRPLPAHVERHQLDATDGRHPPAREGYAATPPGRLVLGCSTHGVGERPRRLRGRR